MNELIKKQLETINQLVKELVSIYHSVANQSGVSDNEFWVWYALLILDGDFSQQDICDLWFLPKQTVNTVISNLSKKEYVYLENRPCTKNRKIIRLTPSGIEYRKQVVSKIYQAELNAFSQLEEVDKEQFISVLSQYIRYIKNELNQ